MLTIAGAVIPAKREPVFNFFIMTIDRMDPLFDMTFQNLLGKYLIYIFIFFMFAILVLSYSMFHTNPETCPMTSGMTYYTLPIG